MMIYFHLWNIFIFINKIKQELVKPLVSIIFNALEKIYCVCNYIILYDREYLNSLYKLWIKNNKTIQKIKNSENSDKSITSSFNSSNEIKSNSFDGNISDEEKSKNSINSI